MPIPKSVPPLNRQALATPHLNHRFRAPNDDVELRREKSHAPANPVPLVATRPEGRRFLASLYHSCSGKTEEEQACAGDHRDNAEDKARQHAGFFTKAGGTRNEKGEESCEGVSYVWDMPWCEPCDRPIFSRSRQRRRWQSSDNDPRRLNTKAALFVYSVW
ncbi:hypothetical protein MRX96_042653 [Rhipicephalus microplus]